MCLKFFKKKQNHIEPQIPTYTEYPKYTGYRFLLTEFGENIEGGFREIQDPTESELKTAVENITANDGEFFTLISDEPINGYTLISGMKKFGEELLTASVQQEAGTRNGKRIEKAYDKSVTAEELLKLLTNFIARRTPYVHDGSWTFDEILEFDD